MVEIVTLHVGGVPVEEMLLAGSAGLSATVAASVHLIRDRRNRIKRRLNVRSKKA